MKERKVNGAAVEGSKEHHTDETSHECVLRATPLKSSAAPAE